MIVSLHAVAIAGITVKSPAGPAWEFLVLFLVVIIGPPLLEHARLPGIIGLLLGGFVIGPYGLNLIGAGNTTVPQLGQLGLLYLMFVAGVELDIGLVRVHRRAVVLFGLVAFGFPMLFGSVVGFSLNWSAPAAILLGSLMASHTLLVYPTVRQVGLAAHRAVATAVGATVLTDTASLVVLAFVSGSQLEGGSGRVDCPAGPTRPHSAQRLLLLHSSSPCAARLQVPRNRARGSLPAGSRLVLSRSDVCRQLRHRRNRRSFLRRAGAEPPGSQRGPAHGTQ